MKSFVKLAFLFFATLIASFSASQAQEKPNTILILDGSGSMWGQVDGVNKITIAREVISNILSDFPKDQNLGFVTYGARQRGQCSDIETVIEPAPDTADEIIKIVNELNPRGMTPMTDAVITAAQALRHTEQAATVILVSDGIETCNPDPCAAARALAQAGVDFTTHVIGFDVKGEAEALMQMQCIAEETGGRFLTADNAQELTEALQQVALAPEPETSKHTFTARYATEDIGLDPTWGDYDVPMQNPIVEGEVHWSISDADFNLILESTAGNPFEFDLPAGEYIVSVYSETLDQHGQYTFMVEAHGNYFITALFPRPDVAPELGSLTLRAVLDTENGPEVTDPINWSIKSDNFESELDANPARVDLESGVYTVTGYHVVFEQEVTAQITFVAGSDRVYTMVFKTPTPTATLIAPESASAGSVIEIGWVGPNAERDNIQIAPVGERYSYWKYTASGNPVKLQMPAQPGVYELRYSFRDEEIIHTKPITVTETEVKLIAPESAAAGSVIEIGWVGPNAEGDNIQIAPVGERYSDWKYTTSGNPVKLQMPAQPGVYELRYSFRDKEIIHTKPITITETEVKLIAPESAAAGSVIEIGWVGPNAKGDNIQIAPIGERYSDWKYTTSGNPVKLQMPAQPGVYELRYSFRDKEIIHTKPITITETEVKLIAPESASVSSVIEVGWVGPNAKGDNIQIAPVGERYSDWKYTTSGNPVKLQMPAQPGVYELRYSFRDKEIIHTRPITVTP